MKTINKMTEFLAAVGCITLMMIVCLIFGNWKPGSYEDE